VHIAIAKKDTLLGSKLEFLGIVWSKVGPYSTPKSAKEVVVRLVPKQALKRSVIDDDFRGKTVDDEHSCGKGFIPKFQWHG